jgi:hypothetical protein
VQIDNAIRKDEPWLSCAGMNDTPKQGPHAGKKFGGDERGGQVVVRPRIQRVNLRLAVVIPNQQNDAEVGSRPDRAAQIVLAHAFHAGIENQYIMQPASGFVYGLVGIASFGHAMTVRLEHGFQLHEPRIGRTRHNDPAFDQENTSIELIERCAR